MSFTNRVKRLAMMSSLAAGGFLGMHAYQAMADSSTQTVKEPPHAWCDYTSNPSGVSLSAGDAPQSRVVSTSTDSCGNTVKQVIGVANGGPVAGTAGSKVYFVGTCGNASACQPKGLNP